MGKILQYSQKISLLILFLFLIFSRVYDLAWGAPYFFHPDERNIASSITQLHFPDQLNPHFFAYGSLPIYLAYLLGVIINIFLKQSSDIFSVGFEQAIISLRVISALLSIATSLLLIPVARNFLKKSIMLPFLFSVFSVGLIQYAHFGTFEMYLTFFSLLQFFFLVKYIKTKNPVFFKLSVFSFAVLVSVKISSLFLFPLPVLVFIFTEHQKHNYLHFSLRSIFLFVLYIKRFLQLSIFSLCLFLITSPYAALDFKSFWGSINYESSVALGTLPVFYTEGFYNSSPLLYQLFHVFPFLLNPINTVILLISIIFVLITSFKSRRINIFLLVTFVLILTSNSMLFVKWTRYVVPTLPFIYVLISIFIHDLLRQKFIQRLPAIKFALLTAVIFASFIFSFSLIKTVYINKDTRAEAHDFAKLNLRRDSKILSEVYDLGIIPFNESFPNIKLFNFYDLEKNNLLLLELVQDLKEKEHIVLPSQRIYKSRILNPKKFPNGAEFYNSLSTNKFELIYKTPCDIFCRIIYLNNPVFSFEETVNVFDRPTVFIYKINK